MDAREVLPVARTSRRRPWRRALAGLAAIALLGGCAPVADEATDPASQVPLSASPSASPTASPSASTPPPAAPSTPAAGTAAEQLATLAVKGRAPMTGYDRDHFGPAWLDADRNGCDTRNDVLGEHLTALVLRPGTRDCVVETGTLEDPFTGTVIHFVRGHGALVDVDHVVALGNAWATGASGWDVRKRAAFANDPMNLLPVDASANRQKGDGDAATWLPPYRPFRCEYVARQVGVKAKYGLWVTPAERTAVERVLADCPDQPQVPDSGAPVRVDHQLESPASEAPAPGSAAAFENCDAARAAGAAPVRRGDPGYGPHLDRDGDGTACE